MKRRIFFFSLLISAISGLVAFGVGVPKGHRVQSHIQTIPDAWRGTWEVTVAYRDHATGDLVVTNVITDEICPGEPITPPELQVFARCSSQVAANEVGVSCQNRPRMIRDTGCDTFGAAELTSQRDGDSWSGTGSWSVTHVGNCTGTTKAEEFVVSGTRISTEAACDAEPSSLLQRFFVHSELVPFLQGRN